MTVKPTAPNARSMPSQLFEHEMIGTSKTLARDHKVNIVFRGEQAKATTNEIVFPALPDRELTHEEIMIGRGFADHESAHKRYTDFDVGGPALRQAKESGRHVLESLIQTIEDARIEKASIQDYPGSAKNLAAAASAVSKAAVKPLKDFAADPKADWRTVAPGAALMAARAAMGNGTAEERKLLDMMPPSVVKFGEALARMSLKTKSTAESIALAKQADAILGRVTGDPEGMGKAADELERGEGKGEGKSKPNGDGEGKGDGRAAGEGDGPGEGQPAPTPSDERRDDDSESGDGAGGGKGASVTERSRVFEPPALKDVVSEVLGTTTKERASSREHTVPDRSMDEVHTHKGTTSESGSLRHLRKSNVTRARNIIASMAGRNATIARKLELMLLADKHSQWDGGRLSGRLDPRNIVRAGAFAAENVFRKRIEAKQIEAAVSLTVDLSGSMGGSKAAMARDCAMLLSQALERCGVSFEVVGFSCHGRMSAVGRNWGRLEAHQCTVFKSFDDTYREAQGAIASLDHFVGCNNPDADAVIASTTRLLARPEKNRLLMVLSDGSPAWRHSMPEEGEGYCYEATVKAVQRAEQRGVRTVGIGIQDRSVARIYPRHAVVKQLEDLAGEALDQIAKALIGDKVSARKVA